VFELKVAVFVLPTQELKECLDRRRYRHHRGATKGRVKRANIYASVSYAVDWRLG